eukprot:TRINITY_DN472_c0_g1_i4.p2 TRINITY_DN472_c0_g1~~TRINITY_DN472_c0_g1_i4.p2  ORF type:complete len:139 (+),score=37.49 TRINITY_DN472_c0_g1_i4:41-457(+)
MFFLGFVFFFFFFSSRRRHTRSCLVSWARRCVQETGIMASAFKKLLPTLNRILVKKFDIINKTKSGIILEKPQDTNHIAQVVAIGPGNISEQGKILPLSVKVGDTVLLPDFGGSKINLKDGEFFLYRDTEILGILRKN